MYKLMFFTTYEMILFLTKVCDKHMWELYYIPKEGFFLDTLYLDILPVHSNCNHVHEGAGNIAIKEERKDSA